MMEFAEPRKVDERRSVPQAVGLEPKPPLATRRALPLTCCVVLRKPDGRFGRFALAIPPLRISEQCQGDLP